MNHSKAIQHFKVDKAIYRELSDDEVEILPILLESSEAMEEIYAEQEKGQDVNLGSNFYPKDVSNEQLEKAAGTNSDIFSPYTIVEKRGGKIIAVPYHIKYKATLSRISKLLIKAAAISKNPIFSRYLEVTSKSLITGDYKAMDQAWLETNQSPLQFLIGPYERYLDKRYFIKMTYLSFVGIQDPIYTQKIKEISDVLGSSINDKPHRITRFSKIQVSSIRNIIFSGWTARAIISTEHFPSDDQTIRESGSRMVCYLSTMDFKFDNYLYPIFTQIFEARFKKSYSEDLLRRGNYYLMFVYGLARQLHRYDGSRTRLKELFPVFDEVNSIVSGIQHCKHLIMKGVLDQKELEAMIIMHICWAFSEWVYFQNSTVRSDYLRGDALALNFYLQHDALKEINGISWPNFSKMFFVIENLSSIFVHILSHESHGQAQEFLRKNLSYEVFKAFDKKLSKLA